MDTLIGRVPAKVQVQSNANPFRYVDRFFGSGQTRITQTKIIPFPIQTSGATPAENNKSTLILLKQLARFRLTHDQIGLEETMDKDLLLQVHLKNGKPLKKDGLVSDTMIVASMEMKKFSSDYSIDPDL